MSELKEVYLDLTPNRPKTERTREDLGNELRQRFEERLPDAVERIWDLPPLVLQKPRGRHGAFLHFSVHSAGLQPSQGRDFSYKQARIGG